MATELEQQQREEAERIRRAEEERARLDAMKQTQAGGAEQEGEQPTQGTPTERRKAKKTVEQYSLANDKFAHYTKALGNFYGDITNLVKGMNDEASLSADPNQWPAQKQQAHEAVLVMRNFETQCQNILSDLDQSGNPLDESQRLTKGQKQAALISLAEGLKDKGTPFAKVGQQFGKFVISEQFVAALNRATPEEAKILKEKGEQVRSANQELMSAQERLKSAKNERSSAFSKMLTSPLTSPLNRLSKHFISVKGPLSFMAALVYNPTVGLLKMTLHAPYDLTVGYVKDIADSVGEYKDAVKADWREERNLKQAEINLRSAAKALKNAEKAIDAGKIKGPSTAMNVLNTLAGGKQFARGILQAGKEMLFGRTPISFDALKKGLAEHHKTELTEQQLEVLEAFEKAFNKLDEAGKKEFMLNAKGNFEKALTEMFADKPAMQTKVQEAFADKGEKLKTCIGDVCNDFLQKASVSQWRDDLTTEINSAAQNVQSGLSGERQNETGLAQGGAPTQELKDSTKAIQQLVEGIAKEKELDNLSVGTGTEPGEAKVEQTTESKAAGAKFDMNAEFAKLLEGSEGKGVMEKLNKVEVSNIKDTPSPEAQALANGGNVGKVKGGMTV